MKNKITGLRTNDKLLLFVDDRVVKLKPSLEAWNKSSKFDAGYPGEAPAQSAIGILLHVLKDKKIAIRLHNKFRDEFLSNPEYKNKNFTFELDIEDWIKKNG